MICQAFSTSKVEEMYQASNGKSHLTGERNLTKPEHLRLFQWSQLNLSKEQKDYAALDAYAALWVWEALSL